MANQDIYTYDPTLQAAQYARQQKMAELMQQQAEQPIDIQSYNGIQAPISWASVLAKGLKAGLGSYLSGEATKGEAALSKAETADALAKIGQIYKLPDTTGLVPSAEPAGTTPTPYKLSMPTFTENAKAGQPTGSQDFTANLNMPNMPGVTTATIPGAPRPYAEQQQMLNEFALGNNRKLAAMAPVLAAQLKPEYKEVGVNGLVRIDPNTGKAITVVGPKPPAPANKTPFPAVGPDGKPGMFVYDETGKIVPVPGLAPFRTGGDGGEKPPSGYRYDANRNLMAIPGGPADTSIKKRHPGQALLKLEDSDIKDVQLAGSIASDLSSFTQKMDEGKMTLGPFANLGSKAELAIGMGNQNAKEIGSFRASLEKLRNDSLRLNKGTQTEGDAVRAFNELFQNINDHDFVRERLDQIININQRAQAQRIMSINERRHIGGYEPIDENKYLTQPSAYGGNKPGASSVGGQKPRVRTYDPVTGKLI